MPKSNFSTRINKEKARLTELFKGLPENEMTLAEGLIERAAWMRIQCEDLEADIEKNGWTEKFQQSKSLEPYDRARPQGQTYQTMNAGYQKIIRQLEHLLPEGGSGDEFDEFVALKNGQT